MKKSKVFKAIAIGAACLSAPLFLIGCGKTDKKYYITFKVDNQTYTYKTTENQNVSNMTNPTKYGHVFEGWYSDAEYQNKVDDLSEYLVANSKADTTLYAKFAIGQFTISFDTNGGSAIASKTQDFNSNIIEPDDPIKPGYYFCGWYSDPDFTQKFIFNKMPGRNITLYAKFESYLIVNNYGEIKGLTEEGQTLSSIIIPEEINGITIKSALKSNLKI